MRKDIIIGALTVSFVVTLVLVIFYGAFLWVYAYSKLYSGKEILSTAQEIASNESDPETVLNGIANWLQNHMTYDTRAVFYYPVPPFLLCRQVHPDAAWVMTIKRGACEEYAILCSEMARSVGIESRTVYNPAEDHTWCEVFINGSWIHFDPGLAEDKRFNNSGFYERPEPYGWGKQLSYIYYIGPDGKENDITIRYTNTGRLIVRVEKDDLPLENAKVVVESRFCMETYSNYKEPLFCTEKYTNRSGLCTFELGGNNYTVIAESGTLLKYSSQSTVHLIENSEASATLTLSNLSLLGVSVDDPTLRLIEMVINPIFILIGVYVGWLLARRSEERRLRLQEIKNELEKAYGPLYSIVSRPEKMVKTNGSSEYRVVISEYEKKAVLDEIMTSYPHMFPNEIVVLWRTEIRDLAYHLGIPLKFKDAIMKEYEKRLEEYYRITGRSESLKGRPKWARV